MPEKQIQTSESPKINFKRLLGVGAAIATIATFAPKINEIRKDAQLAKYCTPESVLVDKTEKEYLARVDLCVNESVEKFKKNSIEGKLRPEQMETVKALQEISNSPSDSPESIIKRGTFTIYFDRTIPNPTHINDNDVNRYNRTYDLRIAKKLNSKFDTPGRKNPIDISEASGSILAVENSESSLTPTAILTNDHALSKNSIRIVGVSTSGIQGFVPTKINNGYKELAITSDAQRAELHSGSDFGIIYKVDSAVTLAKILASLENKSILTEKIFNVENYREDRVVSHNVNYNQLARKTTQEEYKLSTKLEGKRPNPNFDNYSKKNYSENPEPTELNARISTPLKAEGIPLVYTELNGLVTLDPRGDRLPFSYHESNDEKGLKGRSGSIGEFSLNGNKAVTLFSSFEINPSTEYLKGTGMLEVGMEDLKIDKPVDSLTTEEIQKISKHLQFTYHFSNHAVMFKENWAKLLQKLSTQK